MKLPIKRKSHDEGRRSGASPARGRGVFSYYANRSTVSAGGGRAGQGAGGSKSKPRWQYIPSFLAAAAVIISLGYILTLNTNPKISVADSPHGLSLRTNGTYQRAAQAILSRSWLNLNKLTVDTGQVEREMKQQFPELSEVAVTLPLLGHRPVVELAAVQPVLVLVAKGNLVVVASNGKAVAAGASVNKEALKDLPRVDDNSGINPQIGSAALPAVQVGFIQMLTAQLKLQRLALQSITLPPAPNEVDVRLQGVAYFLKFNTGVDARQQVGTFLATRQKLDSEHVTPAEYMDLRVEEKVFYK